MNDLTAKLKEVSFSVLPMAALVLLLHFTVIPLETPVLFRFLIGVLLMIAGLTVFLVGVDVGITPIGDEMGTTLTKTNKVWAIVVIGLIIGFFITIAEPDLHILAGQAEAVTSGAISRWQLVTVVSAGVGVMLVAGLLRIVYNIPLYLLLTVVYGLILIFAFFVSPEFLAVSFDASGTTTGSLSVPFVLALSVGASRLKRDSKASEKDSFGLVAIASTGAILSVMAMSIVSKSDRMSGVLSSSAKESGGVIQPFLRQVPAVAQEILTALLPIVVIFVVFQAVFFHLPARTVRKILIGILFACLGLILFLTGVNAGFLEVGTVIGAAAASYDNKIWVVLLGFLFGMVTVWAEPAVYVLTHQIEEVTSGVVKRRTVMIALSLGVGLAVAFSTIRILVPKVQLWHFLLPGYALALALSWVVPKLFVGIAFDAGGVASGTMAATFILAYTQGAADTVASADVLVDGFGVVSLVALMPVIAVLILGLIFKVKSRGRVEIQEYEQP